MAHRNNLWKSQRFILLAAVIGAAIFWCLVIYLKDILISDTKWECKWEKDRWVCDVSFEVMNTTRGIINCNVTIRGQERRSGERSSHLRIAGENIIKLELHPKEKVQINQKFPFKRKPDFLQIHAW
jgi:hypothetical protein